MRGNVQALFGGEGLVFLGNQDPASYPTLFVKNTPRGLYIFVEGEYVGEAYCPQLMGGRESRVGSQSHAPTR